MKSRDDRMMDRCAHVCHECQDTCFKTIVHCLDMAGVHASREHQIMLMSCAAICGVSHNLLHLQSPMHIHTCRACAEICRACATECDRISADDRTMQECANQCRACAALCEEMAAAAA